MRFNAPLTALRNLRVMALPFAVTVLVGGAVLALILSLTGLLPIHLGGLFAAREATLETLPEATDTPDAITAIDANPPRATGTPSSSESTITRVCEANARRFPLAHPDGTPVVNATRLLALPDGGDVYLIADGRLARVPLDALDEEGDLLTMEQVEPRDRMAGGVPLQELTDLDYDADDEALLVLDKSGRVFGYRPDEAQWALIRVPNIAPDDEADPSYLALAADAGEAYLLDVDLNQLWILDVSEGQHSNVGRFFPPTGGGTSLEGGVDLLVSADTLLALDEDGTLYRYNAGDRRPTLDLPVGATLPSSLQVYNDQVYMVDGLQRTVTAVDANPDQPDPAFEFVFEGMGLLRDMAMDDDNRLLALADNTLIVHALDASGDCPPPGDESPPLTYYGTDLAAALADFRYPLDGGSLPLVPRAYPGARRLYRAGVHHGLDIYPWDVEGEFDIGEPVRAMQAGVVVRADTDYQPISQTEFDFLTGQALELGFSLPDTLDRIGGRQVHIDHGGGISTRFMHLDSVAAGIAPGQQVERGQIIGTVGVSGTGREADEVFVVAHLHTEIWIGDYYLGQGLSLRETMWLWEQIFPEQAAPLPD